MKALALFVALLLTSFSVFATDGDNSSKLDWTYINVEHVTGDVSNFENSLKAEDREVYLLDGAFRINKRLFVYGGMRRAQLNFTDRNNFRLLAAVTFPAGSLVESITDTHFEERDVFAGVGARFAMGNRKSTDLYIRGGLLVKSREASFIDMTKITNATTGRLILRSTGEFSTSQKDTGYFVGLGARRSFNLGEVFFDSTYEDALDNGNVLLNMGVLFDIYKGFKLGMNYRYESDFDTQVGFTGLSKSGDFKGFGISARYAFKK